MSVFNGATGERALGKSATRRRGLSWPRLRKGLGHGLTHVVLIALGLLFFLPFAFMVSTSLKAERQIFVFPPIWIPNPVIWRNYVDVFDYAPFLRYLANTLMIVAAHLIGTVLTCSLAGYAFARLPRPAVTSSS